MLIENFGTTRLSGGEKGSMCNRAPFAKIYRIYIKNNRKVYCETSKHHFSPDRHKHTQVQRGSTLGFDRKLPS